MGKFVGYMQMLPYCMRRTSVSENFVRGRGSCHGTKSCEHKGMAGHQSMRGHEESHGNADRQGCVSVSPSFPQPGLVQVGSVSVLLRGGSIKGVMDPD